MHRHGPRSRQRERQREHLVRELQRLDAPTTAPALALEAGQCDVALICYGSNQRTKAGKLMGMGDVSQLVVPIAICFGFQTLTGTRGLLPGDIWLAIVCGHATRATLSVVRFRQGAWKAIAVNAPA